MKLLFSLLISVLILFPVISFSQTDADNETWINSSPDRTKSINEITVPETDAPSIVPKTLLEQYRNACVNRNESEKIRIGKEMDKYYPQETDIQSGTTPITQAPFTPDWNPTDILVYSGAVAYQGGYRQIDLKQGEDGWMYLAVNRRNVSGYNGSISVYRSSNGGLNWAFVQGANNTTNYFGTISMVVQTNGNAATEPDSTRILVYYSISTSLNMDNARIEMVSFRRTGAGWYVSTFATPPSGNKYVYPSACSDGMYWSTGTWTFVAFNEQTNAGVYTNMRFFRTTTWGRSHTGVSFNTSNPDYYPSAAYCEQNGSDSVYIAVERRISSTEYEIRVLTTPATPTSAWKVYYITSSTGIKYERPWITVQQEKFSVPRKILVTCTKAQVPRYHGSTTGGSSWIVDYILGGSTNISDFTSCNSDSLAAGGGYFIASFVDTNGDSVAIRRGIIGNLGTTLYKINKNMSTGTSAPVVAIYKSGTSKYSAFAYPGTGPTNVYYNQELLPVNINPINNSLPDQFILSQNYPNPFNAETKISFSIPKDELVKITVYNLLGKEIAIIANENLKAGNYSIGFNATELPSGVYFYKIEAGNFRDARKMILNK